jgi:hypothetical protein
MFAQDADAAYAPHTGAPMGWVRSVLLDPTPIKLRLFDILMLIVLISSSGKRAGSARITAPMKSALFVLLTTTLVWFVYGLARGGQFRFASWQTYLILSTVLVSFSLASVFRTPADFAGLAKWIMAAGFYHALMCWISYFTWARSLVGASGAFLTGHGDTITWVVSILVLIVNAFDRRSTATTLRNVALILFLLGAIQFNSRRLAWVSLGMGVAILYAVFPPGAAKRSLNRLALLGIPVVILYVVVGWGSSARIFLPLRSLSTVTTQEDGSTLARNAENLGLIATANYGNPALGTGWGNPYVFLTMKYDISGFELWRYVPHNGILGLLAFTGVLGFAGFWLAFPTAVFFNARVARMSRDPKARNVALVGCAQMVVSANQFYGDMGIFTLESMYVLAIAYAIAMRLPNAAGAWSAAVPKTVARQQEGR